MLVSRVSAEYISYMTQSVYEHGENDDGCCVNKVCERHYYMLLYVTVYNSRKNTTGWASERFNPDPSQLHRIERADEPTDREIDRLPPLLRPLICAEWLCRVYKRT